MYVARARRAGVWTARRRDGAKPREPALGLAAAAKAWHSHSTLLDSRASLRLYLFIACSF
jgi:hypothetical protein